MDSIDMLSMYLAKQQQNSAGTLPESEEQQILEQAKPYDCFGFSSNFKFELKDPIEEDERSIFSLVQDHVEDALDTGFDESENPGRQRIRTHFVVNIHGPHVLLYLFMNEFASFL